ncbi:prepilin peptidase, partial [Candidatus Margulisiibacteriota bacterium]
IGYGDLKLAAMLGSILGFWGYINTFMFSYIIGSIITILLLTIKVKKIGDYIPFGPFLILGAVITLFFGPNLVLALFR